MGERGGVINDQKNQISFINCMKNGYDSPIKARPVPLAASLRYSTKLQFLSELSPINVSFVRVAFKLITCEFISPVYSSTDTSSMDLPCHTSVNCKINPTSLKKLINGEMFRHAHQSKFDLDT